METSLEILTAIQTKLVAPKNQYNSFGKYNYRNVEDILEALKPLLAEYQSAVTLTDEMVIVGDRIYLQATAILHTPHGTIPNTAYAREPSERKGMDPAQVSGATSSYARKYALGGLFACDDNKDPDHNNKGEKENPEYITDEQQKWVRDQLAEIQADVDKFFKWLGCSEFSEITTDKMPAIKGMIEKKKGEGNAQ